MNGFLNEQLSGSRAHSTVALAAIGLLLIYILSLKGESILSRSWGSTLLICFPNLSELFRPANEFVVAHTPTASRRNPERQQPYLSCGLTQHRHTKSKITQFPSEAVSRLGAKYCLSRAEAV